MCKCRRSEKAKEETDNKRRQPATGRARKSGRERVGMGTLLADGNLRLVHSITELSQVDIVFQDYF